MVKLSKTGVLAWDAERLARHAPSVLAAYDRLIAENYAREWFVSPLEIDRETEKRLAEILNPLITVLPISQETPFAR